MYQPYKTSKDAALYKLGEGATGLAAQSKEPVVIENIHNDILFLNKSGNKTTKPSLISQFLWSLKMRLLEF